MLLLLFILALIFGIPLWLGWRLSTRPYQGPVSDHFDGTRFFNPDAPEPKGFADVLKWATQRKQGPWTYSNGLPTPTLPETDAPVITFINHSTFLIRINGLHILTDPVWSQRVSPFSFAGPKRMRPPGIPLDKLPAIDLILLSHNHYDHLDIGTVKQLVRTHDCPIIAPLGVGSFLDQHGLAVHDELDWWESTRYESLKVVATRAQHFSGRGMFDRDRSLWCGFSLQSADHHLVYIGDTGYGPFFKEMGERLKRPIDVAMIPIGAYQPQWFMHPIHVSPQEALQIHFDLQPRQSIACHHGTFPMADDGMDEPATALRQHLTDKQLDPQDFLILQNGAYFVVE